MMKRIHLIFAITVGAMFLLATALDARGPGGGGRGGGGGGRGGGGGGGGARGGGGGFSPSAGHSPGRGVGGGGGPNMGARPNPGGGPAGGARAGGPGPGGAGPRPGPGAAGPGPGPGAGGAGAGVAQGGRPSTGQLNNFLDVPRPTTGAGRPNAGSLPAGGNAAADFLRNDSGIAQRPSAGAPGPGVRPGSPATPGAGAPGPGVRPGSPATPGIGAPGAGVRPGAENRRLADSRPGKIENRDQWQQNRQQRRDEVRQQCDEHHPGDFWQENPGWAAWGVTRPYAWANWGSVGAWCGYGAAQPTYYGYGEGVYYADDQVYYGDQAVATAEQYAQQAATIAASAPETKPQDSQWLPLGVFALTQDGQASGAEPTNFMQLAISKEGAIAGNLKNNATGQVQTIEGMADKKSQRVAWTVGGKNSPIVETGLSSLTQDTAPALMHFADGQTQQWLLVRLPEPKQG